MPVWRLQTEIAADSALPRDQLVITPHFDDKGITTDPDGLCEDLADAMAGWVNGSRQIRVTAYDAQGTPPVFPQGQAIRNDGVVASANMPREVAVCLSFYATRNLPRQRGRLYIPMVVTALGISAPRPTPTVRDKIASLVPIFADLGGADVDWVVYSRADDVARKVTNWFVDDEWDTVRSRGLRPAERTAGTTGG